MQFVGVYFSVKTHLIQQFFCQHFFLAFFFHVFIPFSLFFFHSLFQFDRISIMHFIQFGEFIIDYRWNDDLIYFHRVDNIFTHSDIIQLLSILFFSHSRFMLLVIIYTYRSEVTILLKFQLFFSTSPLKVHSFKQWWNNIQWTNWTTCRS